jgi:hypothetical protein
MRKIALSISSAAMCLFISLPASAEPIQSRPNFVNDHDGAVMPNAAGDAFFVINPDGEQPASARSDDGVQPDQDQDEYGDVSMYQGEDDHVPC